MKKKYAAHFLYFAQDYYRIKVLPHELEETILHQCGGNFWLITEALRHFAKTNDIKHVIDHEEMSMRVNVIWSEFDPEEQKVLETIVRGEKKFPQQEKIALSFLKKSGLIVHAKNTWQITVPLLKIHVQTTITAKNTLQMEQSKHISINRVIVDNLFSGRERKLLRFFIRNKDMVISRERIAEIIWGAESDQYSDWALDQLLRRLRIKLQQLGLPKNTIQTKKNQGFVLTN